jgi:hypothetical protein
MKTIENTVVISRLRCQSLKPGVYKSCDFNKSIDYYINKKNNKKDEEAITTNTFNSGSDNLKYENVFSCHVYIKNIDEIKDNNEMQEVTSINIKESGANLTKSCTNTSNIEKLIDTYENTMLHAKTEKCNHWKIICFDKSNDKLEISIVKNSENNLKITLSIENYYSLGRLNKFIVNLQSRLLHKGWSSQIEKINRKFKYDKSFVIRNK